MKCQNCGCEVYEWNIKGVPFSREEVERAKKMGLNRNSMRKRLERGMTKSRALLQPKQGNGR